MELAGPSRILTSQHFPVRMIARFWFMRGSGVFLIVRKNGVRFPKVYEAVLRSGVRSESKSLTFNLVYTHYKNGHFN
jgi:hypothetical protein